MEEVIDGIDVELEPGAGGVVGSGCIVVPAAGESNAKIAESVACHATGIPSFSTT